MFVRGKGNNVFHVMKVVDADQVDIFLRKNRYYLDIDVEEGVIFGLNVAMDKLNLMEIMHWLKRNSRKD